MKRMIQRSIALTACAAIALTMITATASAAKRGKNSFELYGRVLKVDQKARTALIDDKWSDKLYLVYMPKGATVKITFGQNMRLSTPAFEDIHKNDRIQARVSRGSTEHLAQLEDGRQVVVVSVTR